MKTRILKVLLAGFCLLMFAHTANAQVLAATNNTGGLSSGNIYYGQTGIVLAGVNFSSTLGTSKLTSVTFNSTQTIVNYMPSATFKLYRSSGTTYSAGTVTLVPGTASFPSGTSVKIAITTPESIANNTSVTYYLLADYTTNGATNVNIAFNFASSTASPGGSINLALGAGNTLAIGTPVVTIGDLNSQTTNGISATNLYYGQTGITMFGFTIGATVNSTTVSATKIFATNTITNWFGSGTFKLYKNTGTNYTTGTNTLVPGASLSVSGTTITITGMSEAITAGQTNSYFLVADYNTAGSVPGTEQFRIDANQTTYSTGGGNTSVNTSGGTVTGVNFAMPAPTVTFTGQNVIGTGTGGNGISSTTINYGQTGIVMYGFSLTDANSPTTVTAVNLSTSNNPIAQFFSNFKVYRSTSSTFNIGAATLLTTTLSPSSGNAAFNITGLSESLALNQTLYYFVTADWTSNTGNTLPTSIKFDYSGLTSSVTNTTVNNSNTTGQTFPLNVPVLTIKNSTTGVYTGTTVAANTTYNLLGFTLSPASPTNLHELTIDVNYPNGGDNITSGYLNTGGVQLIDASTGLAATGVTGINVNAGNITIEFSLYSLTAAKSYYLKFPFVSFSTHAPSGIQLCLNSSDNIPSNVCGNNSNCTIQNNYNNLTGSSCSTVFTQPTAPFVTTTTPVTSIYGGAGTVGGNITSTGGSTVTEYGVVYSTAAQSTTPSVSNNKFIMGSGATGATTFSAPLTGLAPNTTYYVNAYAINATGTSYGTVTSFTTLAAPNINYVTPQTYTVGTGISLAPSNTGGAIPSTDTYLETSVFTTSGVALNQPFYLDFDAQGNIYEADNNGGKILKITPAGVVTTFATGLGAGYIASVAVDPAGNVYTANSNTSVITKITQAGVTTTYPTTSLNQPYGLTLDAAGNLYVANYGSGTIVKYAYGSTTATTYQTGLNGPWGLAFDSAGSLYVAERDGGNIYKLGGGTTKTTIVAAASLGGSLRGLAINPAGDIFVTDYNNDVVKVIYAGTSTPVTISSALTLNNPRGITLDPTGQYLYISDSDNNRIIKESLIGYSYTGTLPGGLSFDATTGTFSGNPTTPTVTAGNVINVYGYNSAGRDPATVTIIVLPASPTVTGITTLCGAQTTTLTAAGGTPTGGVYNWYAAATGGTAIASTAAYTPFVGGTTIFYVSYTPTGLATSARTAVTVTVNQKFSSSINSPMISYPFESGVLTDWSVLGNTAVISTAATTVAPTLVADRNGMANSAYLFAGTSTNPSYMYSTTLYSQMPLVFSYSLWFKTTVGGGRLLGFSGTQDGNLAGTLNATHDRDLYMSNTGQIGFGVYNSVAGSKSIATTTTYLDGLWHHVVLSTGPTLGTIIYVDGVSRATGTYYAPQLSAGYWRIAGDATGGYTGSPTNNFYQGTLDDIAIYNHEMTATEAASNDVNLYKFSTGYCANNALTITAQNITGASYNWVDNATPAITGSGLSVVFSNATTTNYTLTTAVNGCSQNTAIVTPNNLTFTWTGAVDNNFNGVGNGTVTNWINTSTNTLVQNPKLTGGESIIIPTGLTTYPVVNNSCTIYSLTIQSGATLNLNGKVLSVGCNIFNSAGGQVLYSSNNASGITWAGSGSNQSFTGSTTAGTTQVGTMTVANTAATPGTITINSGSLDVYYGLNMTTGKLAVTSPAALTLKSSATQSAAVGIVPAACTITGLVNVERFITGGSSNSNRGYRLLSSPVNQTSATSSTSNTFSISYIRDHTFNGIAYPGAYIGGTTGTAGGFNEKSYGPSVYLWDERKANNNADYTTGKNIGVNKLTTNTFPAANTVDLSDGTTSLAIPVGNAFELFFIGPSTRTNSSTGTTPLDAVLTAHGYLNQQGVSVNLWYAPTGGSTGTLSYSSAALTAVKAGYNMVGNPYASTINLNTVLLNNNGTTGIDGIFVLSAKNSPNQTFIAYTNNGTSAPAQGFAVSGEGFIVHAKGAGSTLNFAEAQKSPTTQLTGAGLIMSAPKSDQLTVNGTGLSTGAFKNDISAAPFAVAPDPLTGMYVKITKDSLTYNYCGIYFGKQWSANFQEGDASDLNGNSPRVMMSSFSADGIRSLVKHFPDYRGKDQRIKLYAAGKTDGMYTLSVEGIRNIDTVNYKITLYDNYKRDSTDIGRYKTYAYNQTIADTASYGANRFVLGISQLSGSKYKLASLTAQKANDGVLVTWHALNESNNYFYTLEKQQANGTDYAPVYNIQSNGGTNYSYTDKTPVKGNNVYRLKQVDLFGNITYAGPVSVYYDQTGNEGLFTVYPNPTAETLNINVTYGKTNTTASTYKLNIYDATGSLVMQKSSDNANWSENVSQFKPGIYIVELKGNGGYLLGKAKFVKK